MATRYLPERPLSRNALRTDSKAALIASGPAPADRPVIVITVNEAGRGLGLAAGSLVAGASKVLGGGGGGKPDIAQGGGAPGAGEQALNAAFEAVRAGLRDGVRSGR